MTVSLYEFVNDEMVDKPTRAEQVSPACADFAWTHRSTIGATLQSDDAIASAFAEAKNDTDRLTLGFILLHTCRFLRKYAQLGPIIDRIRDFCQASPDRIGLQAFDRLDALTVNRGELSMKEIEDTRDFIGLVYRNRTADGQFDDWQHKAASTVCSGLRHRQHRTADEIVWYVHDRFQHRSAYGWGHCLQMVPICIRLGKIAEATNFLDEARHIVPPSEPDADLQIFNMEQLLMASSAMRDQMEQDRAELEAYSDSRSAELDEKISGYIYSTLEITTLLFAMFGLLISLNPGSGGGLAGSGLGQSFAYAGAVIVVFVLLLRIFVGPRRVGRKRPK